MQLMHTVPMTSLDVYTTMWYYHAPRYVNVDVKQYKTPSKSFMYIYLTVTLSHVAVALLICTSLHATCTVLAACFEQFYMKYPVLV